MGSSGVHLKMAINNLLLLSSIFATVPGLPPPQPTTTTTEASDKSRTNGLINDVKEINLFLNIPKGCDIVYDGLIKQHGTNVAFPKEQVVQAPRDQVSIGDLLGDKP